MEVHDYYFIVKLPSVIYNQFAAPMYKPMLQCACQKPGYDIDIPTASFENVISVAFDIGLCECESEYDNVASETLFFHSHFAFCIFFTLTTRS